MTIALVHAYRVANRGDGWLVELSQTLIREATGIEPVVYALDPTGMGPAAKAMFPPPSRIRAGLSAGLSLDRHLASLNRRVIDLPNPKDLTAAVGLGGGYLRSADPTHELIFRAHHLPQLRLVASLGRRGAYLPVSVGPFRRGLGRSVRRALGATAWVATRDNRSHRYLRGWANSHRFPDLAACRIGIQRPSLAPGDDGVIGVALRSLSHSDIGLSAVSMLEDRGFKPRFGIQSSTGRTNDDRRFYQAAGVLDGAEDFGRLLDGSPRPRVMVAGRLHAALDAIAAGIPTIHLGYERKSAGAFADLGLGDYVVDAWTGGATELADMVTELASDPEPYWEKLSARFEPLARSWDDIGERVASLIGGRS
ncbi:MAG: hypothetical protein GY724_20570 [Actinomycetia bacterium]|nr:hypothetical protein [Actinomycetes bacterium]MCP4224074.1 hypothetical protein [Actinomycetes bacterium]MCP5032840.1 hypothetical protein [Actinomycetes bacterium]